MLSVTSKVLSWVILNRMELVTDKYKFVKSKLDPEKNKKPDTFQARCLRRILKLFLPNEISDEELYKTTQTDAISDA